MWTFRAARVIGSRCCRALARPLSSSTQQNPTPVDLDYAAYIPPSGNKTDRALVFLHGLFGSKRVWTSLAKSFLQELDIPIYALDLRNQGDSPHVKPMTYSHMATDVLHFIHKHSLSNITLLGHSMGGKAAMSIALHPSLADPSNAHLLSNLIVVDISPTQAQLSPEFKGYIEGMRRIEHMKLKTRKEAAAVLENYEKNSDTRLFLLTNLEPFTASQPYANFRVPLDTLYEAMPEIGWFPYAPGERNWTGRTMFIKGTKSAYINRHTIPAIREFFPQMKLEMLDAGHWAHAERPNEFRQLVVDFISQA